ncbi:MAG: FlgD immunoglobulin-like domain containing protein [Candidatus Desantisbacteria bacterium]
MVYFHCYETSNIKHQQEIASLIGVAIPVMNSPIVFVGTGGSTSGRLIPVRKRLSLANSYKRQTHRFAPTKLLLFCLLSLLFIHPAKPAIAYELKWSTTIIISGQQANATYSLQGASSFVGGPPSSSSTYTVTSCALPTQQATVTITTPASSHKFIPYHNLFHPLNGEKVQIYYEIDSSVTVKIKLYDLTGELVKELVNENKSTGKYWVEWDGKDKNGEECGAGVYIIQIQAGDFKDMRKIVLVR